MFNPLIAKLRIAGGLEEEDLPLLRASLGPSRQVAAGQDLTSEGDRPENVHLVLHGFACRYKLAEDGRRNITALMIPGDFCNLHVAILGHMDHSIGTLTECTVVEIARSSVLKLTENPRITRALWWATLVDEAILREWLVNLGGRDGNRRIAHLICEMRVRLGSVGLASQDSFELPITQSGLGDLMGLSNVHVNRVLKELRKHDLVYFERGHVRIPDQARLSAYCDFNPNYLHLNPR